MQSYLNLEIPIEEHNIISLNLQIFLRYEYFMRLQSLIGPLLKSLLSLGMEDTDFVLIS